MGFYNEALRHFIVAEYLSDMLGCSLALADIQIAQGRLGAATRTFESGLRWTAEHVGLRGAADMHVGLSEVLIERNELDAAAIHLETSTGLGEPAGLPQNAYRWRVAMARLRHAHGDLDGALALLNEAEPHYNTDFSPPVRPVAALRAKVELARGRLDAAVGWATERGLTADDDLSYINEFEHITLARVLLASHAAARDVGSLEDAFTLLNRLLVAADEGHRSGNAIEILVLLAAAHRARGDATAATAALQEARRRSVPEGFVRVFVDAGDTGPGLVAASSSVLVDDLSARELDVLRLLRSDLSGPEIASELHVSLNTFRTHTKNIYAKLGVKTRREATRRGTELGL